jgi:hypothetical protein
MEEGQQMMVIQAIDPCTAIASEVTPLFRQAHPSFRHYAKVLEERMLALENRGSAYLTGGVNDEQLQKLNRNLQIKLSKLFHPMVDELAQELQCFADQATKKIDQHLLTVEDKIAQDVLQQSNAIKESSYNHQQKMFTELTNDFQESFINAELSSVNKLSILRYEVANDILKLDSRIGEIESNNVKDHTLTINHLKSFDKRLEIMAEDIRLTNEEEVTQSDKSF